MKYEYGHSWNDTDGQLKCMEKNLSQIHFVYLKSHMEWPWDLTQASAETGQQLTTWPMSQLPCLVNAEVLVI
jgi:hypothetical protein